MKTARATAPAPTISATITTTTIVMTAVIKLRRMAINGRIEKCEKMLHRKQSNGTTKIITEYHNYYSGNNPIGRTVVITISIAITMILRCTRRESG